MVLRIALPLGLTALLQGLFAAWNVNGDTLMLAPRWAALLYNHCGALIALISCGLTIGIFIRLFHARPGSPEGKSVLIGLNIGVGTALLSTALFLLTDSLRMSWPLLKSRIAPPLLIFWILDGIVVFTEELFTKKIVYEAIRKDRGRIWAVTCAVVASFLVNGGLTGTAIFAVNTALMGLFSALLYERGGLWLPTAIYRGWRFITRELLGQRSESPILYGISETALTGGDRGFESGLWLTALLVTLCAFLIIKSIRHTVNHSGNRFLTLR